MIAYNPKEWFMFIFRFHKSDTLRKLFPLLILIGFFTAGIVYAEINYLKLSPNSNLKNVLILHTLLSFVISTLLVFRTNTAYERWWEGRKLWGSLVNSSRNLSLKLSSYLSQDDEEERRFFAQQIMLFSKSLAAHLGSEKVRVELDQLTSVNLQDSHLPMTISSAIIYRVETLRKNNKISDTQYWMLNAELTNMMDVCGACERIKNTPIPLSYNVFIKKFIFFYVMMLPFSLAFSVGYYSVLIVCFVLYVLASLELIAEEIEDPFGDDENDLPTQRLSNVIGKSAENILMR